MKDNSMALTPQQMRKSVTVNMTPQEIATSQGIGRARCNAKPVDVRAHQSGWHRGNNDRSYPHQIGAHGEHAYSKHFRKKMDDSLKAGGDSGDFDNGDVEVKTTTGNPKLMVRVREYAKKRPKKYVLAKLDVGDWSKVELVGEITREDFDKHKKFGNHGNGDVWEVSPIRLSSIS